MMSKVPWAPDSEIETQALECLCVDLLYRNGFKDIDPVEPQDQRFVFITPQKARGVDRDALAQEISAK